MNKPKIILIGGSAGSFSLIVELLKNIPASFRIPMVVIIHRNDKYDSKIEENLNAKSPLTIKIAQDKEAIQEGVVYFAPAGYHLLIEPCFSLSLDISPPINYCRPAIDATFETAADAYKNNCCAILLSGANQDGAMGLDYINQQGGLTIVQNPLEAEISVMPEAALKKSNNHKVYRYNEIFDFIVALDT